MTSLREVLPRSESSDSGALTTLDSGLVIEIVDEPEPPSEVVRAASRTSAGAAPGAPREGALRSEPRAKHPDEIAIGAFWSTDKDKSGPVTLIKSASAGRDDTLDKWATDETMRGGMRAVSDSDTADVVRPRSRLSLVVLILLVLGAAGLLAYQYLVKRSVAAEAPPSPRAAINPAPRAVAVVEPARSAERPPVDAAAALARAQDVLRGHLTATSQRLQRIAAAALARTGDLAAREVLAAKLGLAAETTGSSSPAGAPREVETSGIARLDLAYSLARAGDKRGSDALAAALGSARPEIRDEAARLLALLGDPRAVPHLTDVLAVSARRLGAAEHLAHLAEPHALKVLDQILGDTKASADDRARAVIALGNAGRADVAPALHDMLNDAHFNVFAAAALAELKDSAARPVLERQLDSPALRVRAARALRRLDPALDPGEILPRLIAILDAGNTGDAGHDIDQVQAAEAILLLAGAPSWSSYE